LGKASWNSAARAHRGARRDRPVCTYPLALGDALVVARGRKIAEEGASALLPHNRDVVPRIDEVKSRSALRRSGSCRR